MSFSMDEVTSRTQDNRPSFEMAAMKSVSNQTAAAPEIVIANEEPSKPPTNGKLKQNVVFLKILQDYDSLRRV